MASLSSTPGSPERPTGPPSDPSSPCSTSSSSSAASNPFLFRRRRRPKQPRSPPTSPSKNSQPKAKSKPKPKPFIGPLLFNDFFRETFSPAMRELFITLGVLDYVARNSSDLSSALQTYEVLNSFKFITSKCGDEIPPSSDHHQPTVIPSLIVPAPQDAVPKQDDDDVWEWSLGPCKELEDVLKECMLKLIAASINVSKIPVTTKDMLLLLTFPQMARDLKTAAQRFESMYKIVRRQLELEFMHAHREHQQRLHGTGTATAGDDNDR